MQRTFFLSTFRTVLRVYYNVKQNIILRQRQYLHVERTANILPRYRVSSNNTIYIEPRWSKKNLFIKHIALLDYLREKITQRFDGKTKKKTEKIYDETKRRLQPNNAAVVSKSKALIYKISIDDHTPWKKKSVLVIKKKRKQ